MMTLQQRLKLKEIVLADYTMLAKSLYRNPEFRGVSSDEIRLNIGRIVANHVTEQSIERLTRKSQKSRLIREKKELAMADFAPAIPLTSVITPVTPKDDLDIF